MSKRKQRRRKSDSLSQRFVQGELLVKFHPLASKKDIYSLLGKVEARTLPGEVVGVARVRLNRHIYESLKALTQHEVVEFAEPNYLMKTHFIPNDPLLSRQYGLRQIQAPLAWNVTRGRAAVLVAIVDTGVQVNHPDLRTKLVRGFNFVSGNSNTNDNNGHGTHVAGIAAAATNNRIGIAGTGFNVRILPVKVVDSRGVGTLFNVARGILFAARRGAKVINLSLGGPNTSSTLQNAVNGAWNMGSVIVAAAGNSRSSRPEYPAFYANAIAVAATNARDRRAPFTSFGNWVDVAAPGVSILSTTIGSGYGFKSGTSMSAPFVSGLAGLLASQGRNNIQIRRSIQIFADRIPGTGSLWTFGRINANRSVRSPR
ncbi:thermitase [Marininema mesophilum]|uniref:Thermitase n=1 Tax=Marininema mesophilum TaxID=1048340 RepID=A0A1H3C2F6_9BACL|nr:S8 family peptidase [Marininema mesophilum]SDX48245.1 thermitase [Marininema mesophilum]